MRYLELTAERQTQFFRQPIIQGEPLNFLRSLLILAVLAWAITPAMPGLVKAKTAPTFASPARAIQAPAKSSRRSPFPPGDMIAEALNRNDPANQF